MWISEKAAGGASRPAARAKVGTATIGGKNAAVMLSGEQRNLSAVAPQGIAWRPGANRQLLVLETDDGERFVLGAADGADAPPDLAEGELCFRCGETRLKLGRDGTLRIDGDVYVTGSLFLNGAAVIAMGGQE